MTEEAPPALGPAGRVLFDAVCERYELRPDELRILRDAAHEADIVDQLQGAIVDAPLIARGSMGQPVVNPLIPELRQHRATLAALLRTLKLPTDDERSGAQETARSDQARAAARARWGVSGLGRTT